MIPRGLAWATKQMGTSFPKIRRIGGGSGLGGRERIKSSGLATKSECL